MVRGRLIEGGVKDLCAVGERWDRLALQATNPFLTVAWITAWADAYAREGDVRVSLLIDDGGALLAGACFMPGSRRDRGLVSTTNLQSNDWDVIAVDEKARRELWQQIGARGHGRLDLRYVPDGTGARIAHAELRAAGYRVAIQAEAPSPVMALPPSSERLSASMSRNLRSQVGRRRRALEREGELVFRTTTGGPALERDMDAFLRVEASGWKQRSGTAILADPATEQMYRQFAASSAPTGSLRIYLLELDGQAIAADLGYAFGGCGYLVKTGFDERWSHSSPGLVLRKQVLDASIDEGLLAYDFLGGPDPYKLRWTGACRTRVTLRAFRGMRAMPKYAWLARARPALKVARDSVRARLDSRASRRGDERVPC